MPKETFWDSSTAVEGDGSEPVLTVRWGEDNPAVTLNGVTFDRSGINRLIGDLAKARNATWGADENGGKSVRTITIRADTEQFDRAIAKSFEKWTALRHENFGLI